MSRESTYLEAVRHLRLPVVRAYLEQRGWVRGSDYRGTLAIFTKGANELQQLLVPINPEFDDFAERMEDVISRVAENEGRTERSVLHDLYSGQVDTLRYRVQSPAAARGTLPLSDSISLLDDASLQSASFLARVDILAGSELDGSGRRYGEVKLSVLVGDDDEFVRARSVLDAEKYKVADEAHMRNRYVVVSGVLNRGARVSTITDVTVFELAAEQLPVFPSAP